MRGVYSDEGPRSSGNESCAGYHCGDEAESRSRASISGETTAVAASAARSDRAERFRALCDSYDRSAALYDENFRELQISKYATMLARVDMSAALGAGAGRVLDLGCGSGLLGEFLREHHATRPILVGLDLSAGMLSVARGRQQRLLRADACTLPFAARSFTTVFAFTVLRILADRDFDLRVAGEVARVLEPGGQFVLTVLARNHDSQLSHDLKSAGLMTSEPQRCGQDVGYVCIRGGDS